MRLLVTGANGFIGRHAVAALLGRGHAVRALVRPGARLSPVLSTGQVDVVPGDLATGPCADSLFEGVDSVLHLAASLQGSASEQRASTVEGTHRLVETMARVATRRLTLVSSFAVYDRSGVAHTLDEACPLLPESALAAHGSYAAAKWEQERVARRWSSEPGRELTVVRPGFVWGRGREIPACVGLGLGPALLVVGPRSRHGLCYVENCADLLATAATDPRAAGRTFNVVDEDAPSNWRHAGNCRLRGTGRLRVRVPVPYALAAGAVALAHQLLGPAAQRFASLLVPPRFSARFRPVRASARAARDLLGWRPPWRYAEALERALRANGA
jgi:UDP-glucose 4-epimerase